METKYVPDVGTSGSSTAEMDVSDTMAENIPRDHSVDTFSAARDTLLKILRHPDEMWSLSLKSWEVLIPLACFTGLWPRLAAQVRRRGKQADVPPQVWLQMEAALRVADVKSNTYRWEVSCLERAMADVSCPLILLKGAAFLTSEMPWAEARTFQDIDVLVPHSQLTEVESALREQGWVDSHQSPLDAMYFRQWLQELAPMWHVERKIQVDIHHSIIPPRDRLHFDPSPLFEDAVPIQGPIYTLSPVDMVLHGTSNLFCTGEFTYILADLYDMHSMLGMFSQRPEFWSCLVSRAEHLNLTKPLYYALRYLREIFDTQVPPEVVVAAECWRPGRLTLKFVDTLVHRTLFPNSLDQIDGGRNLALIVREYWSVPRLSALFTPVFWLKRLPEWMLISLGLQVPESNEPAPRLPIVP